MTAVVFVAAEPTVCLEMLQLDFEQLEMSFGPFFESTVPNPETL